MTMSLKAVRPLTRVVRLRAIPSSTASSQRRWASTSSPAIQLNDSSLWRTKGLIGGQWTGGDGATFEVINPATGSSLGSLPEMGVKETKEAILKAREAFKTWGRTTEAERAEALLKLHALMQENKEDLARLITAENGKPKAEAAGEVQYSASFVSWFAGEAVRNYGDVIPAPKGITNLTIKQPVGVCGLITPWNFPLAMVTRKMAAALAAGCTLVLKAPSETPYTVLAIASLAEQAGVPSGVINVILADKNTPDVGKELCESELVDKISFTGSTRVGKLLMRQSAGTLKKLSMELGGNAPLIVFDDADIDVAVAGTIASKFRLSGQTCVCANRVFVQAGIYDKFAAALTEKVAAFKLGDGAEEGTTHGPLIHGRAVDKVESHVQDAVSKGAKVLVGGKRSDLGKGSFFQPTVLGDVQRCAIDDDETFGPLAALYKFETEAEVLERANEPRVGLAAYFFTRDMARVARVSQELHVGMIGVNTGAISQAQIPFGGVGESGFGREGSKYGLAEYQNLKYIGLGGLSG